jgi:hypothetical protein
MRKLLAAVSLAAVLALNVGGAPPALADYIIHEKVNGDHFYTVYDDKGNAKYLVVYDKDHKFVGIFDSDPNPDGDSSSSSSSTGTQGIKDAIEQALRKGGGSIYLQTDFFDTPVGKGLVETGKTGSIVPYHNPADSLTQDFDGGYGGGKGGIDLNGGSIIDQVKQHGSKKKDDGDDDDDGDSSPAGTNDDDLEFGGASADKELVNPVPEQRSAIQHSRKRTALTRRSILDGGPSLLPAGPATTGTPLVSGAGSPLGSTLR